MKRLPDFIVIGGMKCATSTLRDQLAAQTGIFMSTPKEPNFFSDDAIYARGIEYYTSLLNDASSADLCGEASTHYTKLPTYPRAVERMGRHLSSIRLVYVMRHPVDRLVSHYIHDYTEGTISSNIDQAIEKHPELITYGLYSMQLRPYIDAFGWDSILPVFFERLIAEPQAELDRICRFIGCKSDVIWQTQLDHVNPSNQRLRRCTWRDALVKNRILANTRRRFIPPVWRERIKNIWRRPDRPVVGVESRARIAAAFDDDLRTLGSWLGIGLSCSTFADVSRSTLPTWREHLVRAGL